MGASNADGVGRNRDSEHISGFTACCQRRDRPGVINTQSHKLTLIAGCKRQSLLMARDDDEMFMTRSLNLRQRQQNSI